MHTCPRARFACQRQIQTHVACTDDVQAQELNGEGLLHTRPPSGERCEEIDWISGGQPGLHSVVKSPG